MNRRAFLQTAVVAAAGSTLFPRTGRAEVLAAVAVEQAHTEIWRRFVDAHGIMLDFTALDGSVPMPTPEECRAGKPNALGWWSPIENGAMFNGLYLDGAVARWRHTKAEDDADKARRLMRGLLFLASMSSVPGFIGRGVCADGVSHYPMGSNDQSIPWFVGLWRYLESGLATPEEKSEIAAKVTETANAILKLGWRMPAEPPFGTRGSFTGFTFDSAPRLLFVCRFMYQLTGDAAWEERYRAALAERGGKDNRSRLEACEHGMVFDYAPYHSWTSCTCVGTVRALWEMETDEATRAAFARGLEASADLAFKSLPMAQKFDPADQSNFDVDWRPTMLPIWREQHTEREAEDLAHEQMRAFVKSSPRRNLETAFVREPTAAAWVVSLAPDAVALRQRAADVERVIAHYDYAKLYYSQFFWVEGAWWRLQQAGQGG